ncbi:helix-turn-helix transcriptional regulator [Anaerospora hongkongensis]|uniref:helix-turn-helix domain-containing protein n=1 Tax=Anaerospora hongkongensis TaxID=244830 RepID=UPI002FD9D3D4
MIGKILTELRNNKGLTQDQMSDILGIKRARYNSWENDIAKPDIDMAKKLAQFHGVSTDYLLENFQESNDDIDDILDILHKRPEMKMLFSVSKNATKEDIEKAVKIIEALKK